MSERYLASGDEAGTAPGDRTFRPDVEGLRAVAVLLVVLYHANVSALSGGFVGVDVFFVISGFVITGLLLRERVATGKTSVAAFYARRFRRIIPAATVVILVTVVLSYHFLGFVSGNSVAVDGRWAAVFLANFHFAATGTNYLSSFRPPSPLQNYWSLSVEEQFYAVFPMLFLLVSRAKGPFTFKGRMAICLTVVIIASFCLSVVQTSTSPTTAYFSPLTRAWELGLGALIAVATTRLRKVPASAAALMTWTGLGLVLASAFLLGAQSAYPGWLVALPVLGAGFIIAGGAAAPRFGVESTLKLGPFRWLGRLSYSLYLWHWPVLILAAESRGQTTLSVPQNLFWVAIALLLSVATYHIVENPIRHAKFLTRRKWASIALGVALIVLTLGVLTAEVDLHGGSDSTGTSQQISNAPLVPLQTIQHLVTDGTEIRTVPADITPAVGAAYFDFGLPSTWKGCEAAEGATDVPACTFGDPHGTHTIVLYGDSHALMWARAVNDIAIRAKWKFVLLAKPDCPVNMLPYGNPKGFGTPGGEWSACDKWHQTATERINRLDPDLLIVTQYPRTTPGGQSYSPAQWKRSLEATLKLVTAPKTKKVIIGNIPEVPNGPVCLSRHLGDVQDCSSSRNSPHTLYNQAERTAATAVEAQYVDVIPWFCSRTCPAIIGHDEVYVDSAHITNTYARLLEGVLTHALQMPVLQSLKPPTPDLHTSMVLPTNGAVVSGTQTLDATASDNLAVTKIEFQYAGATDHGTVTARQSLVGWLGSWNTVRLADGSYTVVSVARNAAGNVARSQPVTVIVKN
jgi:peptidoglycan/LPS O-acetylase OafA/YrhL